MNPKGRKRLGYKCKPALFEKVKPHLQIDYLLVSFIKTSCAVRSSEHHDRRFAYQIFILFQAAVDDIRSIGDEIRREM